MPAGRPVWHTASGHLPAEQTGRLQKGESVLYESDPTEYDIYGRIAGQEEKGRIMAAFIVISPKNRGFGKMTSKASKWKIIIPLIIGILVMTAAFIGISYYTFREYEMEDLEDYAKGLTDLIADQIVDADRVDEYLEQGRSAPGYNETEQKLYKLRDAYPDIVYLYVYQIREDGYHVVFDLDTEEFKSSEPGTVEAFYPAFLPYIPDMLEGKEVPTVESQERYGHVLTVCTPLYDSSGACKCYVGADCSMEALTKYTWNVIRQAVYFFLAVVAIILAAGVFVTDRGVIRRMDKLENRAYTDTLTGLRNRTAYYEYNAVLDRKVESGEADFSILMIDINYLKKVNDTYGHEQGNLYLQGAANLIRKVFGGEFLYRIGGDEFVLILEGKAQEGAEKRIRVLRKRLTGCRRTTPSGPGKRSPRRWAWRNTKKAGTLPRRKCCGAPTRPCTGRRSR